MKLGILSDNHGRIPVFRDALALLRQEGAEAFVHCGDIGGIEAVEELAGLQAWFVWGNTDAPDPAWRRHVEAIGLPWPDGSLELELGGKRIAVFHGHESGFEAAVDAAAHDYLLYGHTHRSDDRRLGRMRAVNPGALHRVATRTVALLDLGCDALQFLPVV